MPKVSVLIPAFNAERTIDSCIRSVLNQTWSDFELIVFDDGSTDATSQIIAKYALIDDRVIHQRCPSRGLERTLNAMVEFSRGEYLARLDSDDEAMPERLEKQVAYLESHPKCSLVGSAVTYIDEDGDAYCVDVLPLDHQEIEQRLLNGQGGLIHPSVMIRKAILVEVGGYALDFKYVEDQELWLRIAMGGQLANIAEPLTRYRVHPENRSFTAAETARQNLVKVLRISHEMRGVALNDRILRQESCTQNVHERARHWAWSAIQAGNGKTARKHAWNLLIKGPWLIASWKLFFFAYFPKFSQACHQILNGFRSRDDCR